MDTIPLEAAACAKHPRVPDDIKIIAQFLARREGEPGRWADYTKVAFKLRRELKSRSAPSAARTVLK